MSRRIQDDSEGEAVIASLPLKRNTPRRASSKSIIDSSDEENGLFEDKGLPLSEITGGAPNPRTSNARTTPSRRTSLQAASMSAEKTPSSVNRRRTTARSSPMDDSDDLDPDPHFSIRSGKRVRTATSLNFDNIDVTVGDASAVLADAPIVDDAFNDALSVSVSAASRHAYEDFDIFSEPSTVIPDDLMAMTSKMGKASSSSMSALPVPKPSIFSTAHTTDTLPASPSRNTTGDDPVCAQIVVRPATTSLESQTPRSKATRAQASRESEGAKEEERAGEERDDVDLVAMSAVVRRRSAPGVKKEINRGVDADVSVDLDDDVDVYDLATSTPPAAAPASSAFASRTAPASARADATHATTPSTAPNAAATPAGSGPVRKLDLRAYCTGKRGKTTEDADKEKDVTTEAVKAEGTLSAIGASEGAAMSATVTTPAKEEQFTSTATKPYSGAHSAGNTVSQDLKNESSVEVANPTDLTFKTPTVRRSSSILAFAVPQPKTQDSFVTPSPQQAVSRATGRLASAISTGAAATGHAAPSPFPASPASSTAEMTAEMMATPLAARLKARAQGYNVSLETIDALTPAREAADARTRSVSRPSRPKPLSMHPKTPSAASAAPAHATPTPATSSSAAVLATCPRYPGTLPLLLPKLHAPKAVVFEFADSAVDLNGESGVVGRLQGTAQNGLRVDMQGILFDALFVPSASHMVVSVGEEDVQVEAIVDNVARLYKLGDMQDWEEIEGLDLLSMEDADVDVNKDWKASGGGDGGAEGGKGRKGKGGREKDGEASARGQSKGEKDKSTSTKDKRGAGAGNAAVKAEREKSNSGKTKEAKLKATEKEKKSASATKSSSKSGAKDASEKSKDKTSGTAAGKRKASSKAAAADGDSSESDWAPRQSKTKRK